MNLPLIIQRDGTIYFYKENNENNREDNISNYLKEKTIQIEHSDKLEIYEIKDFSIISLILNNSNCVDEFIKYLKTYSFNEVPTELTNRIKEIKDSMKIVSLELSATEIIIKIMKGELPFLETDKKLKINKKDNFYTYPRENNSKLIDYLAKRKVSMILPKVNTNENIDIQFKNDIDFKLRYYQEQAFEKLKNENKGLAVMPVASGKMYVALSLIEYIKKRTIIFCEGKDNCFRWKELLIKFLNISKEDISICVDNSYNYKIGKINIYSYDILRKSNNNLIFQSLYDNDWGVIIYDNANEVVTNKSVDLLYLKAEYKYAFDSTLDRGDGKEQNLFYLFEGVKYYITSKELVNKLFQKRLQSYKVDLRGMPISKDSFIKKVSDKINKKSLVIVAHEEEDIERISRYLEIESLYNKTNNENGERVKLTELFNSKKINRLCISSNLIEKYNITNIDVMISAGYRGSKKIEEDFKIGTLIGTESQLKQRKIVEMFYLIKNEEEYKRVSKKEKKLKPYGIILNELNVSKYIGDK